MQTHRLSIPITLASLGLLALMLLLTHIPGSAQTAAVEDIYVPLPRECDGINPPGAPIPACCVFGYVFDANSGAINNTLVTITNASSVVFTVTTAYGPHSDVPYFTLDLESNGVNVGETITLTTQVAGRHRTAVYPNVMSGGQQIDLVVPFPDRSEKWTVYLTDTFKSITALAQDGDHLWVGSGGQGVTWLDLET